MDNVVIFIRQYIIPPLEIFIIAFVIYNVYKTLVRTRAIPILKGIFIIIGSFFLASILRMDIILYIIRSGIQIFAITLVIIFSPEIRNIFSNLGTKKMFSKFFSEKHPEIIEIVTETVRDLSETKTGALIVFERNVGLRNYIEATGVTLDSLIKKELLMTIFFKNTPLHDGAVICKGDRVIAASVVVPPSTKVSGKKKGKKDAMFGLRHRAGIGITEESDALAVIVSEETGKISIAEEGRIYYNLTTEAFRDKLTECLSAKSEDENKEETSGNIKKWFSYARNKLFRMRKKISGRNDEYGIEDLKVMKENNYQEIDSKKVE